jgi:hypothetical protein
MTFENPKAVTIKIPREPATQLDRNHLLDIALACAHPGLHHPATSAERKEFEKYIMTSSNEEVSQKVKDVLASLSEEERELLFR